MPVTIGHADREIYVDGFWRVAKRDLMARLQIAFDFDELTIASDLPEAETLVEELTAMRASIRSSGHTRYESPGEAHDDLAIALALAWWGADTRRPGHSEKAKEYYYPLNRVNNAKQKGKTKNAKQTWRSQDRAGQGPLSQNAVKARHSHRKRCSCSKTKIPEDLDRLARRICIEEFQPATPFEQKLVEEIAFCQWKLARLAVAETALWDTRNGNSEADEHRREARQLLPELGRYESRLRQGLPPPSNSWKIRASRSKVHFSPAPP